MHFPNLSVFSSTCPAFTQSLHHLDTVALDWNPSFVAGGFLNAGAMEKVWDDPSVGLHNSELKKTVNIAGIAFKCSF